MPILAILFVGVLIYFALQYMDKQYSLKNKKPSETLPLAVETDAGTPSVETESPPEKKTDAGVPSVETEPPPEEKTDVDVSSVETEPSLAEKIEQPPFIETIPGLPQETKQELRKLNLTTANSIRDTSEQKLLAIKGIGPARLKQIRSLCGDAKNQ